MARARELRERDADAVAALIGGANPSRSIDGDEVRSWLANGLVSPEDMCVLVDGGRVVGYVDLFRREDVVHLDVSGPGHEDELLAWAEERARVHGASTVRLPVWEGQGEVAAVLRGRGYEPVRTSFEMTIDLGDEPPPEPEWPDGIEVRAYRHPQDEQRTYEAQEEAFRDAWDHQPQTLDQWRAFELRARGFDPELWSLAWAGDELAALCLAFPEHVADPDTGWIGVLGVRRPWRRRGVGEALLRRSFRALHARGLRRVGLGVDAESPTGATRLYERVGMRVAVRSASWDKRL